MGVNGALWSPYLPEPDAGQIANYAKFKGVSESESFEFLHKSRNEIIRKEINDPLRYEWESPIWWLCDCLLGVPWVDKAEAEAVRNSMGFEQRVRVLLLLGGNRAGKTRYGLRTLCKLQWYDKLVQTWGGVRTWSFHMTHQQSVEYHHALMWNYLPPELRIKQITSKVNISYGQKDGFTRDKYVLPNGSEHSFRNYSQNRSDAIEGGEPNGFYADELVPGDWIETMDMRLATRDGFGLVGFTPIDGYNSTVRLFCDGAKEVKSSTAWLLPKDNKEPLEHKALGVSIKEYAELMNAAEEGRKPDVISCRPEDPHDWLKDGGMDVEKENGRIFEKVPRVLKCNNGRWGVVYFHSSDNPFGNPAMVISNIRGKSVGFRRERFYGVAEKAISGKFPLFNDKVHVVSKIPDDGTNYQFVDPSSARPFFMLWVRATPEGVYVYREWPNMEPITGLGCMGVWAEPSGNISDYDGKKGPAQKNIGWGFLRYKEEIAKLEGWKAYVAGKPNNLSYEDWIIGMSDTGPSADKVRERYMDARFGNVEGFKDGGMKTLLESFDEINLSFFETTSTDGKDSIDTGCNMINDALFYDIDQPVSFLNKPKLFIHESCKNLIFSLQTYTSLDGATGASKDPIDCLRYFYKKNCEYIQSSGFGGVAGRGVY
jgi:hypothetical protein